MKREVSDANVLDEFAMDFCAVVERYCPYIIVSGFVAISTGRARGTEDIDMIIPRLALEKFSALHQDLEKEGFCCMQSDDASEAYSYLKENTCVRYTRKEEPLPEMEVKFAKDDLDEYQLLTRRKIPMTGLDLWFSSVDMNIAFKEEYLKSPKDLEDARHLRKVFAKEINEDEISKIKKKIRRLRL